MQLPSPEQRIFYERAASQYQADLRGDTPAQAYLMGRGLGPEAAATFRLGVVRNPLLGHEEFTGRLAVPYLTPAGVVTFTFRCLRKHAAPVEAPTGSGHYVEMPVSCKDAGCIKYRAPAGVSRTLFNVLDFKKDTPSVYICEGEIDTLTLSLCGFSAIGMPGVKQWKEHFTKCFQDYEQVFCVADGDKAGRDLGAFLAGEVNARPVHPPQGEDINSLYTKRGIDAVRTWLTGAVS